MKKGYFLYAYGKYCFIETDNKKKTKRLALTFINKIQNHLNRFYNVYDPELEWVLNSMQPATMEEKTVMNGPYAGLKYITFNGDNFSTGTDAMKNPYLECIVVKDDKN